MKKLFSFLMSVVVCFCIYLPRAGAEHTDYVDSKYNFAGIKAVYVDEINLEEINSSDNLIHKVLRQDYEQDSEKFAVYTRYQPDDVFVRKLSLTTGQNVDAMLNNDPQAARAFVKANLGRLVDVVAKAVVTKYYTDYYIIPAHTEWKTVSYTEVYYNHKNERKTRTVYRDVPHYVPDQQVSRANVKMRFTLVDLKTGNEVFIRDEFRSLSYSTDCREAYRQTVRAFFRDLKKKIKK